MLRYFLRRSLGLIPVLLGVSIVVFVTLRVIPGDPALMLAGDQADPQTLVNIRHEVGIDRPVVIQYLSFLANALRGDLGRSFFSRQPVTSELRTRLGRSLVLAATATMLATIVGTAMGVVAGSRAGSWVDTLVMMLSVAGMSVPSFWFGLMMIYLFGVYLQWLPTVGLEGLRSLLLPVSVLSLAPLALIARMTRAQAVEVIRQDYIRTAYSKGLARNAVLRRHVVRNALIPVLAVIGLALGILLSAAVVVEIVFSIDGLGRLLVSAILARDYPVVQGGVLVMAVAFVLINLMLDVGFAFLDPRIRYD